MKTRSRRWPGQKAADCLGLRAIIVMINHHVLAEYLEMVDVGQWRSAIAMSTPGTGKA